MRPVPLITALTLFALLVHGYHPYGEDGGLYAAGIKHLLNPTLYPWSLPFVTEHLRFSLFAPLVAGLVHLTHLGLEPVLFLLYLAGIWTTLYAGWRLLARVTLSPEGRAGGVSLLACWLTLPVAGTSQMLMDPYLTARTFTTPLTLFAAAYALEIARKQSRNPNEQARTSRLEMEGSKPPSGNPTSVPKDSPAIPIGLCAAALVLSALIHPLMAGYTLATIAVILCTASPRPAVRSRGPWALLAAALLAATVLQLKAPLESPDYVWVSMTRYYWFPFRWESYEQLGLFAPLGMLAILARFRPAASTQLPGRPGSEFTRAAGASSQTPPSAWGTLIRSTLLLAAIALSIALLFSRAHLATHLVARMQPLRTYGFVYAIMTLLLGAWLGERILVRTPWRWALLLLAFGSLMFYVQRSTYPASAHLELPGRAARNPYVQAFLWARHNTPNDALFALDAHYITRDGEDAQPFRAIAERSALADYSKDGGEASITPELTPAWVGGQVAQTGLDQASDAQRLSRLARLGVGWVVLQSSSPTVWDCPYRNTAVKVCRLPDSCKTSVRALISKPENAVC